MLIELEVPDGTAEAWLATPDDDGSAEDDPIAASLFGASRYPGVLLFMDAIGLRPRIFEMADRIASWGYVVLAPHVFYREGSAAATTPDGPLDTDEKRAAFFADASPRVQRLTPEQALPDIAAYLHALTSRDDVLSPVGVVGYCMGARLAVRAACAHPGVVAACGGFHGGGLATDAADSPHLGLGSARARFVFGHADQDASMDAAAVERLHTALDEANLDAINEVYAGARHGYTMADTAVFDEAACERHFLTLAELFDEAL
jgi:carboxymethylenebutenolidase